LKTVKMLSENLIKILQKTYEPQALLNTTFKGKDVAFKTDDKGNPVLLFIGRADESGNVKGERYARVLKYDKNGLVIKDHWDLKGKAT